MPPTILIYIKYPYNSVIISCFFIALYSDLKKRLVLWLQKQYVVIQNVRLLFKFNNLLVSVLVLIVLVNYHTLNKYRNMHKLNIVLALGIASYIGV